MRMCAVQRRVPVEAQALEEKRKSINMEETLLADVEPVLKEALNCIL